MQDESKKTKEKIKDKNRIKKFLIIFLLLIIIISGIFFALKPDSYNSALVFLRLRDSKASDKAFSVHFIDVKQGDCSLIISDNECALIDTGDKLYSKAVVSYIKSQGITKLDYIIISHPHADHIGGLSEIISAFEVKCIIISKIPDYCVPDDINYNEIMMECKNNNIEIKQPYDDEIISMGEAEITLFTLPADYENFNNMSIVAKIRNDKISFLFTGDIEEKAEEYLLDNHKDLNASVLKVAHHGSNTSSSEVFLTAVNPEVCIISCGYDNSFNHPSVNSVSRLNEYTNMVLRTDLLGTIVVEVEDNTLNIKSKKGDSYVVNR